MASEDLYINGTWPDFSGGTLERLIAQEAWFAGELDDEANVVWICVGGAWHRLYFDGDVVNWRTTPQGPEGHREEFPLNDLGAKHGLAGATVTSCDGAAIEGGASVALALATGTTITFRHRYDTTTIHVG